MPLRRDVTLVVLAGGKGERMGGYVKPLLAGPDQRTLLERVEAALGPLALRTLIVAPLSLHPDLRARAKGVLLADLGEGPRAALVHAARHAETEWVLGVAGDHVAPSRALAERLLARAVGHEAAAVRRAEVLEPLFAVYRRAALARAEPEGSVRDLLVELSAAVIDAGVLTDEERAALDDVDTDEEASGAALKK